MGHSHLLALRPRRWKWRSWGGWKRGWVDSEIGGQVKGDHGALVKQKQEEQAEKVVKVEEEAAVMVME